MIHFARAKWLVIMDTQWGEAGTAHRWFCINPHNHSGKRLYDLTQSRFPEVLVTNACREATRHATLHGTPDKSWLLDNLKLLPDDQRKLPLLVCGKVAQNVFDSIDKGDEYWHLGPIVELLHPAARVWSRAMIERTKEDLRRHSEAH